MNQTVQSNEDHQEKTSNPIEDLRNIVTQLTTEEQPADKQNLNQLYTKVADYVGSLEQSISDLKVVLGATVQHNTEIENELSSKQDLLSGMWKRYEFIVNSSKDWMCLINRDFCYEAVNDQFLKILGQTREELLGASVQAVWGDQAYQAKLKPSLTKALNGSEVREQLYFSFPNQEEKRCFDVAYYPYKNRNNVVSHIAFVARDITERRNAEELVKEQAQLLDNAQDAIFVVELDGKVVFWNKSSEHLFGWNRDEILSQKLDKIWEKRGNNMPKYLELVLESGEWSGEIAFMNRKGQEVILNSRWTLLHDDPETQQKKRILVINSDVTEKKNLELQFFRAQRMESIGMLASGIAHDLNNILSPFFLAVRALSPRLQDKQSQTILSMLETSAKRGSKLVNQILAFAKGLEGDLLEVDIRHLITELEGIVKETFPKGIRFTSNVPSNLWTIRGDVTQLHQVLLNLFLNARDAMPEGGTLSLTASNHIFDEQNLMNGAEPGSYLLIEVKDTGIGMPDKVRDRIFEPFFTTKEKGKGTGLGLSTVRTILKNHAGFLAVESELGSGTLFKIYLPASISGEHFHPNQGPYYLPNGKGEWVLIADDDSSIRNIGKAMLETYGYKVKLAIHGKEAIELIREYPDIKVAIVDLEMPILDGISAMEEIRKINSTVKLVATSGLNIESKMIAKHQNLFDQFLIKPLRTESLLQTLHTVMQS